MTSLTGVQVSDAADVSFANGFLRPPPATPSMNTHSLLLAFTAAALCIPAADVRVPDRPARTLQPFQSDAELSAYLRGIARQRLRRSSGAAQKSASAPAGAVSDMAAGSGESVTNTQTAGVDEGGIVKVHGNYVVMLRRGRLFTVAVGDRDLKPIATVDAFGPGMDPDNTWYDELLISGDKVVVIGYSYDRGGTEVGTFRIDDAGGLRYLSTYQLRSNDYYSSRNYASRLIGTKLVFYTPLYLGIDDAHPLAGLPSMRKWRKGGNGGAFKRIASSDHIYRAPLPLGADDGVALHTVTSCDLAAEEMTCEATSVLGPAGRVFYVSQTAVYVWVSDWSVSASGSRTRSMLYRLPLDASAPAAMGTWGSPVDQFSFLESDDGYLNVLVRAEAGGDAMWRAARTDGSVALLRVPVEDFGDGRVAARRENYRDLPAPTDGDFQNRFVGDDLLYGSGNGWNAATIDSSRLVVVPWRGGRITRLMLPHGVDRIEQMGGDAVVVGSARGDLSFTGIRLDGRPAIAQRYVLAGASQGELRSHGFFYKPDGRNSGVLGLPVRSAGRPGSAHLVEGSASILYLRQSGRRFHELGTLGSSDEGTARDHCRASCVDWYGNARPLFLRGRVFALLGYELVEGRIRDGRITEVRRVNYAPGAATVVSR